MTPFLAKAAWLLLAGGWIVIRYPYARRARRTPVASSRRGLRERLLMAVSFTGLGLLPVVYLVTGAPRFADYPFQPVQAALGVLVVAAALVMFRLSHKALGRNWSISLDVRDRHSLVTAGIYQHLRHPMYTAFWLWAVAQALLLPNWVAGPAGLVGFGVLFFGRVGDEERMMLDTFGDQYRVYMARTRRIIPLLY
ncbi:isoprenylcysteine carboxylmethyltransferase family protein [Rhodoplanes serenus]|uniref:Isoprenylcysteine carboxylmethyltransferase family protein n=1 Tax=Rhodoplanes serenus TaxID=200615 RepID=A0A327K498_9BRAD|nr:protein-S-isoprenylcysteine O-methyltransferase [Rhodoplanes serenus]MTW15555.1 isoprenylcysteine carboxylmethyltransferase family protein [Rhodoplanes serenus]RAI33187.1 methyltransferase [Rhodoplanes serenus]